MIEQEKKIIQTNKIKFIKQINSLGIEISPIFKHDQESFIIYNRIFDAACKIKTIDDMDNITKMLTILNNRVMNFCGLNGMVNGQLN